MKKRIKILNIITRLNVGGVTIHVIQITKMFTNDQYQSYILSGRIEDNESDMTYLDDSAEIKPYYVDSMSRSIHPYKDIFAIMKMVRIIRKIKPDIVHTHTAKAGFVGRISAWICRVPHVVHTFHGNNFRGYFGRVMTWVSISIEKCMASISDRIIVISNQQKNELLHFRIAPEKKICIIPLGFDFSKIIHHTDEVGKFRAQYNIGANQNIIAFIGRLTAIKNPGLFLDIARTILKQRDDVTFCMIGDGEMKAELEMAIQKANLQNKIVFTGFIQDMRPVYADLDILLLTSLNEGTPVTIIEAMANKKVVISSSVGGVNDLIDHDVNGFTYPVEDVKSFIEKLNAVLDKPGEYSQLKENAHNKITENYSITKLYQNLDGLYSELSR